MDLTILVAGIVQLVLSLIIGVLFIYFGFRFFNIAINTINEIEELKKNNIAVAILNASIIISMVIMVKNAIEPAITIFSNTLRNPSAEVTTYAQTAGIMLLQIAVAGVIAFSSIYIAIKFYTWLTKDLDELSEIKNNNVAVSIVLGLVIISIALLMQQGIRTILDALIPFPQISIKDIGLLIK